MREKSKIKIRIRRHKRIRAKIFGTAKMPRLFAFRSNKHIYAQMINDEKGRILVSAGDLELTAKSKKQRTKNKIVKKEKIAGKEKDIRTGKIAIAYEVGKLIAKKAQEKKIKKVVFDRGGYKYHGRVKALAQGARDGGLKF